MLVTSDFPADAIQHVIDILDGNETLERTRAIQSAYTVAGWLLNKFFGTASAEIASVKKKRISKKQLSESLNTLANRGAHAESFPTWIVPILLDMIANWLAKK